MAQYEVRVENTGFELYLVQAGDEGEALANWSDGEMIYSEVMSIEDVSIRYDYEGED